MTGAPARTPPPGARSTSLPVRVLWLVARTVGTVALTFLGLLLVTFLIGRVVPIDPVLAAVGDRAPAEVYERVKQELGLDLPLWQQFWLYLKKVLAGDFGRSVLTSNPVLVDIRRVLPGHARAGDGGDADRRDARHPHGGHSPRCDVAGGPTR